VTPNEGQSWDLSYILSQVKSNAGRVEGIHYKRQQNGFKGGRMYDIDAEDIPAVWNNCYLRLRQAMHGNVQLRVFRGFQFFINSKGHKHRTHTDGFSQLMSVYKEMVPMISVEIDLRSNATSIQTKSIRIDFGSTSEL